MPTLTIFVSTGPSFPIEIVQLLFLWQDSFKKLIWDNAKILSAYLCIAQLVYGSVVHSLLQNKVIIPKYAHIIILHLVVYVLQTNRGNAAKLPVYMYRYHFAKLLSHYNGRG